MKKAILAAVAVLVMLVPLTARPGGNMPGSYPTCVDGKGAISLPGDFRAKWAHLGSRAVPDKTNQVYGFHDVYAQQSFVEEYKKTGAFHDGAVIVMEVRSVKWDEMTSGHVLSAGDVIAWFVMVRDDKGRFPGNPNWGDGWGWARFKAEDPGRNASADYKNDCLPCHEDAKGTQWVYVEGYPALR